VLDILEQVKLEFGDSLTWADLIVLAGNVALEEAGAPTMDFCGGRSDANINEEDPVSKNLEYMNREFYVEGRMNATVDDLEQYTLLLGLNAREFTAIMGARALGQIPSYNGMRTNTPTKLGSAYYQNLVSEQWRPQAGSDGAYTAAGSSGLTMLRDDILLISAPQYKAIVQEFAGDESAYLATLAAAWTKMMNADRFDGPTGNVCEFTGKKLKTASHSNWVAEGSRTSDEVQMIESANRYLLAVVMTLAAALLMAVGMIAALVMCPRSERKHQKHWNADLRQPLATYGSPRHAGVSNQI